MLQIQLVSLPPSSEAAQFAMSSALPPLFPQPPHRPRLRHYLVGSPADTQRAIDRLHLLHYAERIEWSRVVHLPENGLIVQPDPGDVLRYLQRRP
ncbi:MAG: hypothetical protein Fur0046_40120 [Cyanobacteria bacterium J069]|nr:MAG: hypothetical protein D6742_05605 [Cyanobacteria bacterium J069]